jgi:segregation and condensation protein B
MSLKAKIEAVIYASEEPVTLAQLVGLLGQEAQVELDQIAQAQQALDLNGEEADADNAASEPGDTDPGDTDPGDTDPGETDVDGLNREILSDSEPASPATEVIEALAEAAAETAPPATEVIEAPAEAAAETTQQQTSRENKEEKEKNRRLREYFRSILDQLVADYANGDRGLEIREVASGYRLATKPEYHDAVRGFVKSLKPPLKLSLQALETLAVVAYKQPVTAPEVSEIRGVDSGGVLGSLMTRKLVTTAGRKQVIGRPILYKTTKDFLLRFGLKDINELPSIEEFEKMASELAEQEEIPMEATSDHQAASENAPQERTHHAPETPAELEPERHTHLPQADGSPDPVDDPLDDQIPDEEEEEAENVSQPKSENPSELVEEPHS